jgi:hypothetical protein
MEDKREVVQNLEIYKSRMSRNPSEIVQNNFVDLDDKSESELEDGDNLSVM